MNIYPLRQALATLLGTALSCDPALPAIPSTLRAGSLYVRPATGIDYVTFDGGTFCRPVVNLAAVVVGPTADWLQAAEWLDQRASLAVAAVAADTRLGGLVADLFITSVSEPGLVPTSTGDFMAFEIRFAPIHPQGDS